MLMSILKYWKLEYTHPSLDAAGSWQPGRTAAQPPVDFGSRAATLTGERKSVLVETSRQISTHLIPQTIKD